MKKLALLLTAVFALVVVSGASAQIFGPGNADPSATDDISLSITFTEGTYSLVATLSDPDNDTPVTFTAGGAFNKIIGKALIEAEAGGLFEIVAYTDNLGSATFVPPAGYPSAGTDLDKQNWIGQFGGLVNTTYGIYLPVKIRSEAKTGLELNLYGSVISADDFGDNDPNIAAYLYIAELAGEVHANGIPQVIASTQLGSTPEALADLDVAFGAKEGLAANVQYDGTIYFEMRHN
ncbi:MAG: hypothetical protein RBU23_04440 [Candidatus Auribacterota bacterium]|nr:hypothetical protein [Candidatus Auribacterota bacterium]